MLDDVRYMKRERVGYLGRVDDAIDAVKRQRFGPVVKRWAEQLLNQTRRCVDLLVAFSTGVEKKDADPEAVLEADFPAFWEEVQRRAVAEGALPV